MRVGAEPGLTEAQSRLVGATLKALHADAAVMAINWTSTTRRLSRAPDDLFDALLSTLPPREDRNLEAPLFPDLNDAALRTAITKACKATGTPHFSPHGLRRRRGSLYYKRGPIQTLLAERQALG